MLKLRSRLITLILLLLASLFFIVFLWSVIGFTSQRYHGLIDVDTANNENAYQHKVTIYDIIDKKHLPKNLKSIFYTIKDRKATQQILAIILAYSDILEQYYWDNTLHDFVFIINNRKLFFANGRLIFSSRLKERALYRSIMYQYPLQPLHLIHNSIPEVAPFLNNMKRSSDLQTIISNASLSNIRLISMNFLGNTVVINPLIEDEFLSIEKKIFEVAKTDIEVKRFIETIYRISCYSNRTVENSSNISLHAYGLAVDMLHNSYNYKAVYWQWTKIISPKKWKKVPLEKMWLIPDKIVKIFEEHGFSWGGKWANYDTIHFEYRPEIIEYANINNILNKTTP